MISAPQHDAAPSALDVPAIVQSLVAAESKRKSGDWSIMSRWLLFGATAALSIFAAFLAVRFEWVGLTGFEFGVFLAVVTLHELGHLIAAKWAGYRNLKMVLLPMLGGAVHGEADGVPPWKQGIMLLAGPVPGILIGLGVAIAYKQESADSLQIIAVMLALINVFNLLPIQPLDGGKLAHMTVFCRIWWAQTVLLSFSALAMFSLAWLISDWVVTPVFMLMGIGSAANAVVSTLVPRIADHLRNEAIGDVPAKASELSTSQLARIANTLRSKLGDDITMADYVRWIPQIHQCLREPYVGVRVAAVFIATHVLSICIAAWTLFVVRTG